MKPLMILSLSGFLLTGCVSRETGHVSRTTDGTRLYGLDDQPQSSVGGEGTLMPGAYGSRQMQTGQFIGKERTSDQVGQRPVLPGEADPRDLTRENETEFGTGAGTLGQAGIVPGEAVSSESLLMETPEWPPGTPAHVAVDPPGSDTNVVEEAVGAPARPEQGSGSIQDNAGTLQPD